MIEPTVTIIQTGVANTASVAAAFARIGFAVRPTSNPRDIERAPLVILPGVGSFAAGMTNLHRRDLVEPMRERVAADRPLLAICLGMQLLFDSSEEAPGVRGLGCVPGEISRLPDSVRVPQFGWNTVAPDPASELLKPGYAYFANSFCASDPPPGWTSANSNYGQKFLSAIERGTVLATQFHPELSGQWGLDLLRRWVRTSEVAAPC